MRARAFSLLLPLASAACGSTSVAPADASVPTLDASDASVLVDASDAGRTILPYPAGPYGGGIGEVVPDFRIQGFALSRTERDSTKLPFRDITLGEIRSDPACTCMVIVRNAVGTACPPCMREDRALVAAIAAEPTLCAAEVTDINFDGITAQDNVHPPTRADIEEFTQSGRQNFPVGLLTDEGNLALSAGAIGMFPIAYVFSTKDMRMIGFFGGIPGDFRATAMAFCRGGPFNPVETLATGLSPRRLLIDASFAYVSDHNAGIVRVPLAGGAPESIAKPASAPEAIAIDATRICWATHDGGSSFEIGCSPKTGGAPTVLSSGTAGYLGIAIDGTDAYFTRSDGVVGRVPLTGGAVTTLSTGESKPTTIGVDASEVFWLESGTSALVKMSKTGGARTVLVPAGTMTFGNSARDFVLDTEDVIAISEGPKWRTGAVDRVPKAGGTRKNELQLFGAATVALDSAGIILVGSRDPATGNLGVVAARRLSDGFPDILTPGQKNVTSVAGDGTKIYWITNADDVRANGGALKRSRRVTATEVPL